MLRKAMLPPLPALARAGRNTPHDEMPINIRPGQLSGQNPSVHAKDESDCESDGKSMRAHAQLVISHRRLLPPPVPLLARGGKNTPFTEIPVTRMRNVESDMSTSDSDSESADEELYRALTRRWSCGFDYDPYDSPRSTTGSDNDALSVDRPLTRAKIQELMCREITPEDYEVLLLLDEGVKKDPTLSSNVAESLPAAEAGGAWMGESCSICLSEMSGEDDVRTLPSCGHCFHAECAARWLSTYKAACPLCGTEVDDRSESVCSECASHCSETPCSTPR